MTEALRAVETGRAGNILTGQDLGGPALGQNNPSAPPIYQDRLSDMSTRSNR